MLPVRPFVRARKIHSKFLLHEITDFEQRNYMLSKCFFPATIKPHNAQPKILERKSQYRGLLQITTNYSNYAHPTSRTESAQQQKISDQDTKIAEDRNTN